MTAKNSNLPDGQKQLQDMQSIAKTCLMVLAQKLMDIEVSQILSASRYERSHTRRAYRNGYRNSTWQTELGQIELQIPKLRRGTYYPNRLLNENGVRERLIQIVHFCMENGVQHADIANSLASLGLFQLSTYEIHQICDELNLILDREPSAHQHQSSSPELRAYQKEVREQSLQDEHEFWKDFSRRMALTGADDESLVLLGINPYARIEPYTSEIIKPAFTHKILQVA